MSADEQRLWQIFREEARERTAIMVEGLRRLAGEGAGKGGEAGGEAEGAGEGGTGEAGGREVDLTDLDREAHTLKGAAGLMGQDRLYALAQRIETALKEGQEGEGVDPETARLLIRATEAFLAGTEAAAEGKELPASVGESLDALEAR